MKLNGKWPFFLSLSSLPALACYCLLAWSLIYRYDLLFDAGYTIEGTLCGRSMLHFIWWGAGLAGWFFIRSADAASSVFRAYIWGVCQFASAWILAYPAASLGIMNDGFGIMLILFAPLVTLPSFVAACVLFKLHRGGQSPSFYFRSRLFSFLVILAFIVTTLSSFLYEENRERHNPTRLMHTESWKARYELEQKARAEYRDNQHRKATEAAQLKFEQWRRELNSVVRAEFCRTGDGETHGSVVPPVEPVEVSGDELNQLLSILRRSAPVPQPDPDVLTPCGSEPLKINSEGNIESLEGKPYSYVNINEKGQAEYIQVLPQTDTSPIPPDSYFAIDRLRLFDAEGNIISPEIPLFGYIVSRTVVEQNRNKWIDRNRPFLMLEDEDHRLYLNLPSFRTFVERMKQTQTTESESQQVHGSVCVPEPDSERMSRSPL